MDNRIGQRLGNYHLSRLLGQGSFADVYLGEHIHLDTHQVAIKVLNMQVTGEDVQRFHAEARILAGLAHPHIVRLLDYTIEGNIPYVIMEYAPNGTFRQRFPKGTKLPLTTIVPYVMQIAYHHMHTPPPPLREKVLTLPQAIEQVVMKALAKQPEERYASVLEFAHALDISLKHAVQVASEPTVREKPIELVKAPRARVETIPVPESSPVPHRTKEEWLRKGLTHYNAKQYKDAIIAFSYAIKVAPAYATAYARRGQVYAYLKEFEKAIKDFDRALVLDPQLAWVAID